MIHHNNSKCFNSAPGPANGRSTIPGSANPPHWSDSSLDGRSCTIRLRHHSLTLENVSRLQSRIHPVRAAKIPQVHQRKLDSRDNSRSHTVWVYCPGRPRSWLHSGGRSTGPRGPPNRLRNTGPVRPETRFTSKTNSRIASRNDPSRSDNDANVPTAEEDGTSGTIGNCPARNRPNPNDNRSQLAWLTRRGCIERFPRAPPCSLSHNQIEFS